MLQVYERLGVKTPQLPQPEDSLTLDFDTRQKARIKALTDANQSIGIFVARGHPLKIGELLKTECGKIIEVKGAEEPVITARTDDWHTFSKVCYHLGNRHTQLQVGERWLRFKSDHVLQELVEKYGLVVDASPAVFEPESGAYGGHGHSHSHSHEHAHSHDHEHNHDH